MGENESLKNETYSAKAIRAVDLLEKRGTLEFETMAIAYLAASGSFDLVNANAYTVLADMKCIKKIPPQENHGRLSPTIWSIIKKPGKVCKGCQYAPHKHQQSVCARRESFGLPTT